MNFISVFSVVTAVIGLLGAVVQLLYRLGEYHEARRVLTAAEEPRVAKALRQGDLKSLGDYFFNTLGRLPLSGYADDAAARRVVSDAVRNVESFVRADRSSVSDDADALIQRDAERAESDIAMGDFWAGLSRLRRQIELSLRAAALNADVPVGRMGPGQLLSRLAAAGVIPPAAAEALHRAISICNRAVHGEPVSGEEAEEALALAADGLAGLNRA